MKKKTLDLNNKLKEITFEFDSFDNIIVGKKYVCR